MCCYVRRSHAFIFSQSSTVQTNFRILHPELQVAGRAEELQPCSAAASKTARRLDHGYALSRKIAVSLTLPR